MLIKGTAGCCALMAAEGGRATLTGWENVLLFKGGRKSETTLKSEYAFSGDVVKFCEILGEGGLK